MKINNTLSARQLLTTHCPLFIVHYPLFIPYLLLMGVLLTGCNPLHPHPKLSFTGTYCDPPIAYQYDSAYLPKPNIQQWLLTDSSLTRRFSRHDLLLANAMGILPLLQELTSLTNRSTPEATLRSLAIRQKIQDRFILASTQIDGLAAELDCEGERADQIATYLDQRDTRRIRRLTILSVVIGAVTTVATTLIPSNDVSKVVGISGGVIGAGFGGMAAFSSNRQVTFSHARNLLADIWYQPNRSLVYPPMIWYVLNEAAFSNTGQYSICTNIRNRWKHFVLDGNTDLNLYFGEGGNYDADDLHNRANMLNQLQSSVRSVHQDLQSLALALAR